MKNRSSRFFIPTILVILAYEWLVSGLDKLLSGTFVSDMHQQMMQSLSDMQYQFYAQFLQKYCMAHCAAIATAVEVGEIAVGLIFAVLAYVVFTERLNPKLLNLGVFAGIISAFMTLNFYFYQGGAFFVNTSDPFDEGIPIDLIMVLIQIAFALYFWTLRKQAKQQPIVE